MEKEYPEPTVGLLIINDKNEILLIKSPKWRERYVVPGGHIEMGEKIEEAVKREAKEEVGLDVEFQKVLFVYESIFSPEFSKKKHFISLRCLCKAKDTNVKIDNDEASDFMWVDPKKSLELNLSTPVKDFIKKYLDWLKDEKRDYKSTTVSW
jgi:nucleoside triphosphatase